MAPGDRIATFDQDGTTWVEQPLYGQGLFALDRLAEMAPEHPEWKETEPFKSVLTGDHEAMGKFSEKDWMEIVAVTHAGMSTATSRRSSPTGCRSRRTRSLGCRSPSSSTSRCSR